MTPKQRQALKLAREKIRNGENDMLCFALFDVADEHPELTDACCKLTYYIHRQLSVCGTLVTWQWRHGIYHDHDQRRIDRINWISWMLGELE